MFMKSLPPTTVGWVDAKELNFGFIWSAPSLLWCSLQISDIPVEPPAFRSLTSSTHLLSHDPHPMKRDPAWSLASAFSCALFTQWAEIRSTQLIDYNHVVHVTRVQSLSVGARIAWTKFLWKSVYIMTFLGFWLKPCRSHLKWNYHKN